MKIVQAMVAKGYGGAERYFVDLSNYLVEQGHSVLAIIHKDFRGKNQLTKNDNLDIASFNVLGWWDVRSRLAMQKRIHKFNGDIIHSHLARATYLCGHISKNLNIPLIVKTHNYIDLKYYRNVNLFIPTTHDQKRYLVEKGVSPEKIKVIPNFSKIEPLEDVRKQDPRKPFTFYAIGRMVKKKGFDVLLSAFARVLDKGHEARLEIAGDGPEFVNLEKLVDELGIKKEVDFIGWVDDIKSFLRNKEAFILPSLDEPFGIVVLEAMALGKPIISTKTQGPKEILDEETASLVEINSSEMLAEAMERFLLDEEFRYRLADRALKKFKQEYSQGVVVPRVLEQYQKLKG